MASYKRMLKPAFIVLCILGASVSLAQGLKNAVERSQDFQWSPSRALLNHEDPYSAYLRSNGHSQFMAQTPAYPASGLIFIWPYAALNWTVAKSLWAMSNIIFTAIILYCVFSFLSLDTVATKLVLATTFIMGTPWRNDVGNGQHAIFAVAFFLLAVCRSSRSASTGLSIAVSWFKYTISFPLSLYFARSRRGWGALAVAALIHGALLIFASAWVHADPWRLFLEPARVAVSPINGMAEYGVIDTFAIASRLGYSSPLLPALASLTILVLSFFSMRRDRDTLSCLSILSLASMAVCYHGPYDFVVLVIPLAYALRERLVSTRANLYILVVAMIWFADKLIGEDFGGLLSIYFWIKTSAFYAALGADWLNGFGVRAFEKPLPAMARFRSARAPPFRDVR